MNHVQMVNDNYEEKKYRILYWCGLYKTEYFVKADNTEAAEKKFRDLKGNNANIISIEEVKN